ncbi:aminoacyl-tRNA hydrolase [Candidatus Nomurabacteria bacterium]|nr:aminoacyl-tRNA hydrolase [Candidatus Nomurabacteria bacterium]
MMPHLIVGLGNPGEEYKNTRHNAGRIVLERVRQILELADWKTDKKWKALKSGDKSLLFLLPETMMNNSGKSLVGLIKNKKSAAKLIVVHDDLDLPTGILRISWNRGSGGHRGLDSIIKQIKTREFVRIRLGIGKKQPILKHILGNFKPAELKTVQGLGKKVAAAIELIVEEGKEKAMTLFN